MSDLHQLDKKALGYEPCESETRKEEKIEAYKQEIRYLNDLLLVAKLEIAALKAAAYVSEMGGL